MQGSCKLDAKAFKEQTTDAFSVPLEDLAICTYDNHPIGYATGLKDALCAVLGPDGHLHAALQNDGTVAMTLAGMEYERYALLR